MINAMVLKAALVAGWFALMATLERVRPAAPRPAPNRLARIVHNGAFWVQGALINPLLTAPISLWAASAALWERPAALSGMAGLIVDLIILDLWIYIWHRLNHVTPILWRFHETHHLDEFLDATSAVRFHPGELIISAAARAAIILLAAIPMSSVLIFETLVLASTIFHHSNLRLPAGLERALRLIIVTPSHHWVHHHARRADTDSNYATVLSVWDRLFDTLSPTTRTPDMPIGVHGASERRFAALMARPFRRSI